METGISLSYDELKRRLDSAESALKAIREGRVDSILGGHDTLVLRLAQAEAREKHLKQVLLAIRNVNQLIVAEDDPRHLIHKACENLTETMGYFNAWIALFDETGEHVRTIAAAGFSDTGSSPGESPASFGPMRNNLEQGIFTACMRRAIQSRKLEVTNFPTEDCSDCPLASLYTGRAGFVHCLTHEGHLFGTISVSVPALFAGDPEEQALFEEVATDIAFALFKIKVRNERENALAALHRNHKMLARTEAIAHLGSWEWDIDGDQVRWSEELFRIFRRDPNAGAPSYAQHPECYLPEDMQRLREAVERCLAQGIPYELELGAIRSDGEIRHCVARGQAETDETGRIIRLVGSLQDVTEVKKQAEHVAMLGRMLDDAPASITIHDTGGRFLFANAKTFALHGYDEKEFMTMNLHDLDVPESEELLAERFRLIDEKGEASFEVGHYRKDGSIIPLHILAKQVQWEGLPVVLSIANDMTERKRLERQHQALVNIIERSRDFIGVANLYTDAFFVNPAGQEMVGLDGDDQVAKTRIENYFQPEDLPFVKDTIIPAVMKEGRWAGEFRFRHFKTGETIPVLYDLFLSEDPSTGEMTNFATVTRDISDRKRADAERETSLHQHQLAMNLARLVHWEYDIVNDLFTFNDQFYSLYGTTAADQGGYRMSSRDYANRFLPQEEAHLVGEAVEKAASTNDPEALFVFEHRIIRADGRERFIIVRFEVIRDQSGRVIRTYGANQDITERKRIENERNRMEEALRASEERLDRAMEVKHEGIWDWNLVTNQAFFDDRYYIMAGYSPGEFPQTFAAWADHVHPEDLAEVSNSIQSYLSGKTSVFDIEFRFLHKKGHWIWIQGRGKIVERNLDGSPLRIIGTHTDITERKIAEQALRDSEERFRAANEASLDALMLLRSERDENGEICDFVFVDVNRCMEEMLRMSREQLLNKRLCELLPINKEAGFFEKYKQVVDSGVPLEEEFYLPETHVPAAWYYHQVVKVQDGIFICHRDIGERKRAEAERENLRAQLQQAQKMESIGRLAGGVAHDFNNMLQVILGHSALALQTLSPTDPLHESLIEIKNGAQRSADLTRQLLAFARKETVAPKVLDLNSAVGGVLRMLKRLIGEDIDLLWKPGDDLWPVRMDPAQLDQILANLCVNARDAIDGVGKITIETGNIMFNEDFCTLHSGFQPGRFVQLSVSDDGCGMDTETISHLFEPFFTTKEMGRGTGLGLASVYGAVRQNNGFINVYSEPGQGTIFKIYLPNYNIGDVPKTDIRQSQKETGGSETVILVEDEPAILKMITKMLGRLGYNVIVARTPGEAIQMARDYSGTIDLLLTDVIMPEMNGRDLAKNLLLSHPNIRCLFMSGYTANVIAHHGVLDEGVHFIQKPFSMEDLSDKIRGTLTQPEG